jgi:hypothetical protein
MPRVFSRSQGKVIDIPESGGAVGGGGLGEGDSLNQLLGLGVLSGDVKSGTVTALQNLGILPPQETTGERTGKAKRARILGQAAPVLLNVSKSALAAPTGLKGFVKAQTGRLPGVAGGEAEALRRQTEGFARLIASAFASEVGVATDKDVKRWLAIMPQPGDTLDERKDALRRLSQQIESESASLGVPIPPEITQVTQALGDRGEPDQPTQQPPQQKEGVLGGALPFIGGALGGGIGSLLGPPGAIGGTAAGAGGGVALEQSLEDLLGRQKDAPGQQLATGAKQVGGQTLLAALPTIFKNLSPVGLLSKLRGGIAQKSTATAPAQNILGELAEFTTGPKVATGQRSVMQKLLGELTGDIGEKSLGVPELLSRRTAAGQAARAGSGEVAEKATAKFNEVLRRALKGQIRDIAPEITPIDAPLSALQSVGRGISSLFNPLRLLFSRAGLR